MYGHSGVEWIWPDWSDTTQEQQGIYHTCLISGWKVGECCSAICTACNEGGAGMQALNDGFSTITRITLQ